MNDLHQRGLAGFKESLGVQDGEPLAELHPRRPGGWGTSLAVPRAVRSRKRTKLGQRATPNEAL